MDLRVLKRDLKLSGNLPEDTSRFFVEHDHAPTAAHCGHVARKAGELAGQFEVKVSQAETAGWLHDISTVIPNEQRVQVALDYGLEVLPEEHKLPMIIHQKLSVLIAHDLFNITDAEVLSAIGCHTTLKADASPLDKVVFIADKIAWDQEGEPPYLPDLLSALEHSLDAGTFVYLEYLWRRRKTLPVLHSWVREARQQLASSEAIAKRSKMNAPNPQRLAQQLTFITEIDRLKQVLRQTTLLDTSRRENSAEHSWHLAVMASVLLEYAPPETNLTRVLEMLLLHDIVEIDAGDTFCYDVTANLNKAEREQAAAKCIFGLLPDNLNTRLSGAWHEFEAGMTVEARFANALDRLQPFLHNYYTQGGTWQAYGITKAQVLERMHPIEQGAPALWPYVLERIDEACELGYIAP